jgi:chitinase
MAYDYAGPWDTFSGHQSNLFPSEYSAFSTSTAVQDYISAGVDPSKVTLVMPLYGRGFENTDGIGKLFNAAGDGLRENGVWDYKVLPRPGATEHIDSKLVASYLYDPSSRELISYDTSEVMQEKLSWLKGAGLVGSMF